MLDVIEIVCGWAGAGAHLEEGLLHTHRIQSVIDSPAPQKLSVLLDVCNPSIRDVEVGRSEGQAILSFLGSSHPAWDRLCLK